MKTKQLPKDWQEVELGEICEIKKGNSITKNTITNGDIPVIAGGQQPAYYHNNSNRIGETLTISGSGAYAGFVAYFNIPIFASDCSTIQSKEKNVFMKYIYYFLKGNQNRIYKLQKGMAQPHVYPKDLMLLKIPLPALQTQKAIVSILEKAEALKQKREDADKLTKEYLQSVFYEMFGDPILNEKKWVLLESKKCFRQIYGMPLDSTLFGNSGKPLIRIRDLLESKISIYTTEDLTKCKEIPLAKKGDLLIGMDGDFNLVKWNNKEVIINQRIVKIEPKKGVEKEYLRFAMPFFVKIIEENKAFVTVKHLSDKDLKQMILPIPPLPLQQTFASIVEHVEKLKEKQKTSKEEINLMFDSLMKQAFNGELVK